LSPKYELITFKYLLSVDVNNLEQKEGTKLLLVDNCLMLEELKRSFDAINCFIELFCILRLYELKNCALRKF
jgi:hypothetical protein